MVIIVWFDNWYFSWKSFDAARTGKTYIRLRDGINGQNVVTHSLYIMFSVDIKYIKAKLKELEALKNLKYNIGNVTWGLWYKTVAVVFVLFLLNFVFLTTI